MITVKDFMETVNYRISEGHNFCWQCFGSDVYTLDSWNGDQEGHSISITFDTRTQTVYQAEAFDYKNNRAYRMINPEYVQAYHNEGKQRSSNTNEAWEGVDFVDLETDEDFLEKARAIVAGEDYDTRVSIPLDLPDEVLFDLMKQAHEHDMTLNDYVESIVRVQLDLMKQELETKGQAEFSKKYKKLLKKQDKKKNKHD